MYKKQEFRASIAPMMDWTDRHCRWFHRLLSGRVWLYTEMVVADAVIHGDRARLLDLDPVEHPVAVQLGGSDGYKLAEAMRICADYGYDEVNLNIGCPSDRVQSGRFGACLMAEPALVARCYSAMAGASSVPVTVKCRLGIDDQEAVQSLPDFIARVADAGCTRFIIHARKAWLKGLSPKENRTVPPLDYDLVRRMKAEFPALSIEINGGLETIQSGIAEAESLDGFMIGRAAYHNPWILTEIDAAVFGDAAFTLTREDIASQVVTYLEGLNDIRGGRAMLRHIMGLYAGQPGARHWRRNLSEFSAQRMAPAEALARACAAQAELAHIKAAG